MTLFPDAKTIIEFSIGSLTLTITWYAALILIGAFLAYGLSQRKAKRLGYEQELLEDYFITMLPLAIIGARLYYCIFNWDYYGQDLIQIFYIWNGGLAIHGGLIVGIAYSYFYFKYKGVNLLRIGDCIMPNVLLAQAIGRWGNFANGEAYGSIVAESFFDHYPTFIKEGMYIHGFYRMPMFLYESIANILGFLLIKTVFQKYLYRKKGDNIYAYITWYGIVRFFIEFFRTDALMIGPLRVAQVMSLIFVTVGLCGYFGLFNKFFKHYYPFSKQKPILLFDLDATILDSEPLIRESFVATFRQFMPEYELSEEELRSFLGPTLQETFSKYFKDETQMQEAMNYYIAYQDKRHDEVVKPMPHALEMLETLKEKGYTLGVVSNKLTNAVHRGLASGGFEKYMDVVVTRDDVTKSKPDPEGLILACKKAEYPVDDVIYVGDAANDIQAAKNMGAYSIGYQLHDDQKETFERAKANRIITDLMEIVEIVEEDLQWNMFAN